ncbi:trigger factor-related chaperone [Mycoplasmopsis opalescens]|uniref:trigger factor-related chaperone n=1 Tax=Mycoplasmopsis opalescens TaxID=114886 RepID=UPI0004A72DF5|nr:hypothetical protein [Mycoplasmopsis opalescens]
MKIDFLSKIINVNKEEWKKTQNNVLLHSIKNQQKVSPDDILALALQNNVKFNMDNIIQTLVKDENINHDELIIPFKPTIEVVKVDKDSCEYQIKFSYTSTRQFANFNLKFDCSKFSYPSLTEAKLEEAYQAFVKNYQYLDDVSEVNEDDIVSITYNVSQDSQELAKDVNLTIKASKKDTWTINQELIGAKLNDTIGVNDPDRQHYEITIKKIRRIFHAELTKELLPTLQMETIKTLDDLKAKLFKDFKKDFASQNLLQFYHYALEQLILVNNLQPHPHDIDQDFEAKKEAFFKDANEALKAKLEDENNEENKKLMHEILLSAITNKAIQLAEVVLSRMFLDENDKLITNELISNELRHIEETGSSDTIAKSPEQMHNILRRKLTALRLAKINDENLYNNLSNDLNIYV